VGLLLYHTGSSLKFPSRIIVVTLLAHGCPVQAIVAAFGFDERTAAAWWARSGRPGQAVHEHLVEQPLDLGQVQADERESMQMLGVLLK
jgi:hypothetical protein